MFNSYLIYSIAVALIFYSLSDAYFGSMLAQDLYTAKVYFWRGMIIFVIVVLGLLINLIG